MRIFNKYFLLVIGMMVQVGLLSQNANNPFELKHRVEAKAALPIGNATTSDSSISNQEPTTPVTIVKTNNPFDIVTAPSDAKVPARRMTPVATQPHESSSNTDFLFWSFLFVLLFFTAIMGGSRKRIEQIYGSFRNDNLLRQVHRANQGQFSLSYLLLYLLFFMNGGLFAFLVARHFGIAVPNSFSFLVKLFLAVGGVFLLKHFFLLVVGWVFPIKKEIQLYSFTVMVFSIILGLTLLPLNLLIAYAPAGLSKIGVYGSLGAIIAIYLFRSLRGLAIGSKYLMLHKFHFLLYLCAVEILPVIVLVKIILLRIE